MLLLTTGLRPIDRPGLLFGSVELFSAAARFDWSKVFLFSFHLLSFVPPLILTDDNGFCC